MLDYRYQTFLVLCAERNYTKTAEKLFITQPAVTQHIQWLEHKYQTKLVSYQNREIRLTNKGQLLYRYLQNLQAQIKKIETNLTHRETANKDLNFATTLSIGDELLPRIVQAFAQSDPKLNISCLVENTQQILQQLRTGDIDFALVEGNFPKQEFAHYELSSQPFIAIASTQSSYQIGENYHISDLLSETLITREKGSGSRKILDNLLAEQNYAVDDFSRLLELGSLNSIKELVKNNLGIAFLYEEVVKKELIDQTYQKINIQQLETSHSFYFIYLNGSLFEPEFTHIFDLIKSLN
ncbi:LysR family transcriptional regulator [Vagococcus sp. BWB3-3]|uniref:LysR family transcriptional regulator n=1 Tax=Vagococcus allomyrinae TaxID=2794353 RepID=A0A940P7E9_9ENTE|nr:LysR family transcriptional regulator [Vagococcus allomyrinae]MBP1039834.1 LysR family transcriptional regulator [Vagococcus allomyrinae]